MGVEFYGSLFDVPDEWHSWIHRSVIRAGRRRVGVVISAGAIQADGDNRQIAPRARHTFGTLQAVRAPRNAGEADVESAGNGYQWEHVAGRLVAGADLYQNQSG